MQSFLKKVMKGDSSSQFQFYRQYYPLVLKFVEKKIGDSRDGEEIAQNVITSAIYCLPTYSGKNPFGSWIFGIARHEIADFYRKKKIKEILFSFIPGLETIAGKALSPETAMREVELKEKIILCLSALSEGYTYILRLRYIDELSLPEIAQKIGAVSTKAVEMKLRRARLAFKYYWTYGTGKTTAIFDLSARDVSILAQHFGIAYSPLPHPASDLERA